MKLIHISDVPGRIRWGDYVQLIKGGPICLVVDLVDEHNISYAVIAWEGRDGEVRELLLPKMCLRKV